MLYDAKLVDDEGEAPQIIVSPIKIPFGKLEKGRKSSKSFVAENRGGPVHAIDISWEDKPDWGELEFTPDPHEIFPIKVTILVDTNGVAPSGKIATITVNVDGYTHSVSCSLQVEARPVAPSPSIVKPPPTKATSLPAAGSGWLFKLSTNWSLMHCFSSTWRC